MGPARGNRKAMGPARGNRKEKKRKHSMRNKLLVSTAALLAGVAIASAQEGQNEQMKGQSQRSQAQQKREQTTGQAGQEQKAQPNQAQQQRGDQGKQGKAQQRSQRQEQRNQTTGQAPQNQQGQQSQPQTGQQGQTTGQAPQRQQSQTPQQGQSTQTPQQGQTQTPQQGQAQQGQAQQSQAQAGNVTLNAQQRTTIRQTVLAGSNVPRVNNVNFALSVGTVVPTSVRFVDVPPALIEINSAWRGHQYFVVRDDIVIVDHSRKIVAVVPVGSGGGASLGGGGAAALNLSPDQIREIQIVLNERGFNVGRPDGHLGKRTIEALTTFQRQQGFQATGRIDSQTVSALGLSNKMGAQGGATSGQSGLAGSQGGAQNQGANQPSAGQGSSTSQPSTSGQAPAQKNQGAKNQPSTSGQSPNQAAGAGQPSTTGQGGPAQQFRSVAEAVSGKMVVANLHYEFRFQRLPRRRAIGGPSARAAGSVAGESRGAMRLSSLAVSAFFSALGIVDVKPTWCSRPS